MVSNPKPGDRVQLWYAAARRPIAPHHGHLATVVTAAKGRGPRNHLVRTDAGELVIVPAGNLRLPKP